MSQPVFHFVRRGYDPAKSGSWCSNCRRTGAGPQKRPVRHVRVTKLSTLLDEQKPRSQGCAPNCSRPRRRPASRSR